MATPGRIRKPNLEQDGVLGPSTVARHDCRSPWLFARAVVAAVFLGFCLIGLLGALATPRDPAETALGAICLVILLAIQLLYFARPAAKLRAPASYAVLGLQAVLVHLPLLLFGNEWAVLPGFLAGSALLVLPRVAAWPTFLAIVASVAWLQLRLDVPSSVLEDTTVAHVVVLYSSIGTVITGLVIYGLTRFTGLVADLHATRIELARLAVEHERATFARDLNNLLGQSLSEIALRGELTHRLLRQAPERAGAELERILDIARRALADVRSIANRYRPLSLDQEIHSVAAMLDAADMTVRINIDSRGLPAAAETALALTLREGVTNMLRHSHVQQCEITMRRSADGVRLDIVNDGVLRSHDDRSQARRTGLGQKDLAEHVVALAGQLTCVLEADDRYRLSVYLPVQLQPQIQAEIVGPPAAAGTGQGQHVECLRRRPHLRSTRGLATAVFAGFFLIASVRMVDSGQHPIRLVGTIGCMAALLGVQLLFVHRPTATLRRPIGRVLLGMQAVLVLVPLLWSGADWVSLPGFVAGNALLLFRPATGWALFASVLVAVAALESVLGASTDEIAFIVVSTMNSGLATWGLIQLANLVADLQGARSELARAAVAAERLRFARDVHDLLGLSLSAIALKGELANRLLGCNPNRAAAELAQILNISRCTLAEVWSVASGESVLLLERERVCVESALTAADVEVRIELDHSGLSTPLETLLATVLREGATNMLRHSDVTRCEITLVQSDTTARLEMVNDGVPDPDDCRRPTIRRPAGRGGHGLRNLAERVAALGGELSTAVEPDRRFRLRVTVPLQPAC
jgi:signal transduction histidine kinase